VLDYFAGEWEIKRSVLTLETKEQVFDDNIIRYSLAHENGTSNLIGRSFVNDTNGEISQSQALLIETEGTTTGAFKTGDDPEEMVTLFNFNFVLQYNGQYISHGTYKEDGIYQFVVSSWDKFILTVLPKELKSNSELVIFTARKMPDAKETSFFQKYGTYLMLGAFFIFNIFIQNKTRQGIQQPAAPAPAPATATTTGGRRNRGQPTEEPTVEEVTDEDPTAESEPKKKKWSHCIPWLLIFVFIEYTTLSLIKKKNHVV